eukprot:7876299-Karenia_brevis.AAC.1
MTIASTVQQRLAGQLLDEQVLAKNELSDMLRWFQDMPEANMKGKTTITSTDIRVLLEDSIDAVKVKPSKKK